MKLQWLKRWVEVFWYQPQPARWLLYPVAVMVQVIHALRRYYYEATRPIWTVPIIVVGNLTVGGVGKTPLVIAIARALMARGLRVGIVSRGYGAKIAVFPHEVLPSDTAWLVGDEPKLMALKTGCPVVIAPKRRQAVDYLRQHHQPQWIISDDGLQHYAMDRTIEIVVVDGQRGFGNGLCLPAGPLRESQRRLETVDFIVVNGEASVHTGYPTHVGVYSMTMMPGLPRSVCSGEAVPWSALGASITAVAGIGHPKRFFTLLGTLGVRFESQVFPDHHPFSAEDLSSIATTILMTEKDAVKCQNFATQAMYCLPVEAKLSDEFWTELWTRITLS